MLEKLFLPGSGPDMPTIVDFVAMKTNHGKLVQSDRWLTGLAVRWSWGKNQRPQYLLMLSIGPDGTLRLETVFAEEMNIPDGSPIVFPMETLEDVFQIGTSNEYVHRETGLEQDILFQWKTRTRNGQQLLLEWSSFTGGEMVYTAVCEIPVAVMPDVQHILQTVKRTGAFPMIPLPTPVSAPQAQELQEIYLQSMQHIHGVHHDDRSLAEILQRR